MSARTGLAGALLLGLLLSCLFSPASTSSPTNAVASGGAEGNDPFNVSVALSAYSLLPAEPVLVTARLVHSANDPFRGYVSRTRISVIYTSPSGERRILSLSARPFCGPLDELPPRYANIYGPGYTRETSEILLYTPQDYSFQEPGSGSIAVRWRVWKGERLEDYSILTSESPSVSVETVRLPPSEVAALALWRAPDKAQMFLAGVGDDATKQELQALVDLYPDSAYAKYALMALAAAKRAERESLPRPAKTDNDRQALRRLAWEETELLAMVAKRYPKAHILPAVLDRLLAAAVLVPDYPHTEKYAKMLSEMPDAPQEYRANAARTLERLKARR